MERVERERERESQKQSRAAKSRVEQEERRRKTTKEKEKILAWEDLQSNSGVRRWVSASGSCGVGYALLDHVGGWHAQL